MNRYINKAIDYAAGSFFNKILLIILLPIFTHFLVPEEFAVYTNLMIFFSLAGLIYTLGIQQAIFSHFYDVKSESYQFTLVSSIYIILTLTSLIFSLLIVCFRAEFSQLVLRTDKYSDLFYYLAIILFFNLIFTISLSFLNILEKSRQYAVISALQNVFVLLLIVVFSLKNQFSVTHYFLFMTISTILASIVGIWQVGRILQKYQIKKSERSYFSASVITSMFKFGITMVPGIIAILILQASDRYMLTYLSTGALHDVGIYAAGYRIGMIMHFLVSLVSLVYQPYAMKIAKEPQAQKINGAMFKYYIIFGCLFGMLIISYSQEIFRYVIDAQYMQSYKIVFAGVVSSFLYGIFNIVNINFYVHKRAGNITLAVLIGAVLNIVLNFILIPQYGVFGAGIASVISYFVIVIFNYFSAAFLFKIKYDFGLIFPGLIVLAVASLLNAKFNLAWNVFIIKTVIFIILAGMIYLMIRKSEKFHNLLQIINKQKIKDEIQN
jgi:O-antigen/teichoic acid export membrane protein